MATVFRKNEISLFDVYYPIIGVVQPQVASRFAPKQVIGDYTKDSELVSSSWIMSDQSEGIGIKNMEEVKDAKRCWWSTSEIGYRGHLLLPVLITATTNPTTADAAVIIEYGNEQYAAFGTAVHKWAEGSSSWGSSLYTLPSAPTDAFVHKGKLYFACATDFIRFDGTSWTTGTVLAGTAQPSRYFVEWDGKLFDLDNTGQLDYSTDEGVTWTTNAKSSLTTGYFNSLLLYRDVPGEVIIYMGTKQGLYALDYDNAKWYATELSGNAMPFHDYACKGALWWRDALYLSSGLAIYRYVASNPAGVSLMGPDRDYGIPGDYRGNIVKLIGDNNAIYALLDATSADTQDLYPAGQYGDIQDYDAVGFSAVLRWDTKGWSVSYLSADESLALTTGVVSTADDIYRLWFAVDGSVSYMPLQQTIQNPLEISDFAFGASSEHISPWFDADNSVVDKLAVTVRGLYKSMTATEYIKLYYGLDYDDDTWTPLTNTTFADGQIDANGETEFTFASDAGLAFKAIRFKEELARGSSSNVSPDRNWIRLTYIKLLDVKWGFNVKVDCSRNYRFKTARSLVSSLKTALDTQTLGAFIFKDGNGSESHQVRIANLSGAEIGGKRSEGVFEIQLIAP